MYIIILYYIICICICICICLYIISEYVQKPSPINAIVFPTSVHDGRCWIANRCLQTPPSAISAYLPINDKQHVEASINGGTRKWMVYNGKSYYGTSNPQRDRRWWHPAKTNGWIGHGSIPIDTFLVGWTSIYQLFWGSLGTRVLTHPHLWAGASDKREKKERVLTHPQLNLFYPNVGYTT